jgi:flagellar basal-body rod modification protein FlgD
MELHQTSPSTTTPAAAAPESSNKAISSDFETFLKMLTVQMQNQDPLNPVDSADYAVQLATFSSVEQQVKTNDLLESLASQMGLMGISQLAGWVGMEARAAAPAQFDGNPISVSVQHVQASDESILIVRNSDGEEVQRSPLDRSESIFDWAGVTDDGDPYPPGQYSFHVESRLNGETVGATQAETYSVISEARSEAGQVVLVLQGGAEIAGNDVTALRALD